MPPDRRRVLRLPLIFTGLWIVAGEIVIPLLICAAYEGRIFAGAAAVREARGAEPLGKYLSEWASTSRWIAFAALLYCLFAWATAHPRFVERCIGRARAADLGFIRIVASAVMLIVVALDNLPSTALLPREMLRTMGFFSAFRLIPGFDTFLASPIALGLFQIATLVLLVMAMLGYRTRITLPLAAVAAFMAGGIVRQYFRLYHQGLIPMYVMGVLAFTPCADALSLDARRGRSTEDKRPEDYAWGRWICWLVVAVPYVVAGLNKLRRGGFYWWDPINLKRIVMRDSLMPMEFNWDVAFLLIDAPDALFLFFGLSTVVIEIAYGLVLVSRLARWILPACMVGLHIGIWLMQNVLFLDMILLQLIFIEYTALRKRAAIEAATSQEPPLRNWGRFARIVTALMLLAFAFRAEFYPLSAMQMYAVRDSSGRVEYYKVLAHYESGLVARAPLKEWIPVVSDISDTRYRTVLQKMFERRGRAVGEAFLRAAAGRYNERAAPGQRVNSLEVQRWEWEMKLHPSAPERAVMRERILVPVQP